MIVGAGYVSQEGKVMGKLEPTCRDQKHSHRENFFPFPQKPQVCLQGLPMESDKPTR